MIGDEPCEDEKIYTLATKPFLLQGGDGYSALGNYEDLIVDDEGIPLATLFRNYFIELKVLNALTKSQRVANIVATAFTKEVHQKRQKAAPKTHGRIVIVGSE